MALLTFKTFVTVKWPDGRYNRDDTQRNDSRKKLLVNRWLRRPGEKLILRSPGMHFAYESKTFLTLTLRGDEKLLAE